MKRYTFYRDASLCCPCSMDVDEAGEYVDAEIAEDLLEACRDALITILLTCNGRKNCATPDEQVTIEVLQQAILKAEGGKK